MSARPGACEVCGCHSSDPYRRGHRDGHAAGYEAAVREFWRAVCEEQATEADENGDAAQAHADACPDREYRQTFELEVEGWRRFAAQLRAWAREGA